MTTFIATFFEILITHCDKSGMFIRLEKKIKIYALLAKALRNGDLGCNLNASFLFQSIFLGFRTNIDPVCSKNLKTQL